MGMGMGMGAPMPGPGPDMGYGGGGFGGFTGANSDGLEFAAGTGNVIECNLIGITHTNSALTNNVGVHFSASGGNRVGGTNAEQKNVISVNTTSGSRPR